jgi:hypothetical protein
MPWESELAALERAIAAVNAEYDSFLYGSGGRPPVESRKKVERLIRSLSAKEPDAAADRYRFSTLQGRWIALGERWEKLQEEKEAGRRPGLYGRFQPPREPAGRTPAPPPAPLNETPRSSVEDRVEKDSAQGDPRRALFEKYVAARRAKGEPAEGLDFERFADSLRRETERVRERFGGADVEFDVAERDGKIKLVAKKKT